MSAWHWHFTSESVQKMNFDPMQCRRWLRMTDQTHFCATNGRCLPAYYQCKASHESIQLDNTCWDFHLVDEYVIQQTPLGFFKEDCCEFVWDTYKNECFPSHLVRMNLFHQWKAQMHPAECLPNQRYIWEADPLANAFAALARKGPHELKPRSEQVSICERSSTTRHKQTSANIYIHSDKRPFIAFNLTWWHVLTHLKSLGSEQNPVLWNCRTCHWSSLNTCPQKMLLGWLQTRHWVVPQAILWSASKGKLEAMGSLPTTTPKPSNEAIHLCSKSAGTIMAKFGLSYRDFLMKLLQLTCS